MSGPVKANVEIDFIIGGQSMTAGNAPEDLRKTLAHIEDDFRRRLAGLHDTKRGAEFPLRVRMVGNTVNQLNWQLTGPKEVVEEAQRRLGGTAG